jgi:hypothetical protein
MDIVPEGSSSYVTVTFKDKDGNLAVPLSVTYSTYCNTTGTAIKTNVALTPASSIVITLNALDNAIIVQSNSSEEKVLTVKSNYGVNDNANDEYVYQVKNLKGV